MYKYIPVMYKYIHTCTINIPTCFIHIQPVLYTYLPILYTYLPVPYIYLSVLYYTIHTDVCTVHPLPVLAHDKETEDLKTLRRSLKDMQDGRLYFKYILNQPKVKQVWRNKHLSTLIFTLPLIISLIFFRFF